MVRTQIFQVFESKDAVLITGWQGDQSYFQIRSLDKIDVQAIEAVDDVLKGRLAAVVIRSAVAAGDCEKIQQQFWASSGLHRRGAEAPGYYIGAFHWGKTTDKYIRSADEARIDVAACLSTGDGTALSPFDSAAREYYKTREITYRAASFDGMEASYALVRSWTGDKDFALNPHEDLSQCTDPKQSDFEIQGVVRTGCVGALNICLQNEGRGGALRLWNLKPDEISRTNLDVQHSGSPYPPSNLNAIPFLDFRPSLGDLYVFDGALLHAVLKNGKPTSKRSTAARLIGYIDDQTVAYWA